MKKSIYITGLLLLLLLLFCGCGQRIAIDSELNKINEGGNSVKYENVKIVVDDNVIESNDVMKIIDPLWWSVSIYDGEEKYNKDLARFSVPQKYVFAIEWYVAEVNNGGHDQFYSNSTGIVWEDAMNGFEVIGLSENNKILNESVKRMGGNPGKDRERRQAELDKFNPTFDDLDDRFYKSDKDMDKIIMKYIKDHKIDFYFDGTVSKPKIEK